MRNLERIRAMGNPSLEEAERQRGEQAIGAVLEQLAQALTVVGDKANSEKVVADAARAEAEVRCRCCCGGTGDGMEGRFEHGPEKSGAWRISF